jgi:hypothetical protein
MLGRSPSILLKGSICAIDTANDDNATSAGHHLELFPEEIEHASHVDTDHVPPVLEGHNREWSNVPLLLI